MDDEFLLYQRDLLLVDDVQTAQTSFGGPALNTFILVTVSLVKIDNGAGTTIALSNRELQPEFTAFPLVRAVNGIGSDMGEHIPAGSRGTIEILNEPNSFGNGRRFSDLLEDYTVIDKEIIISIAQLPLNDETIQAGDFTEKFRGVCTGVRMTERGLTLSVNRNLIPNRVLTRVIDSDTFPDAPVRSLGRHLPLIFSKDDEYIEVEPLEVTGMYSGVGVYAIDYAYATTYADQFLPGDSSDSIKIYMEDQNREFQLCTMQASPNSPFYSTHEASGTPGVSDWGNVREIAYKLTAGEGVTGGEVIIGVDWDVEGGITDDAAEITCKVWSEANGWPHQVLAQDTILGSESGKRIAWTGYEFGGTIFTFTFNRAIVIPNDGSVFVSLTRPKDPSNDTRIYYLSGTFPAFEEYVIESADGYRQDFRRDVKTTNKQQFRVYGVAMEEAQNACATGDLKDGLGYSTFTLSTRKVVAGSPEEPNLAANRWLCAQQGLRDDSAGTLTGVSNYRLFAPIYQAALALAEWDGTDWVNGAYDIDKFNTTHYDGYNPTGRWYIQTSGATQGRTIAVPFLEELCRNSASRIVPYGSTGTKYLGMYAHGTADTPVATLDDEDFRLISLSIGGVETVVNRATAIYGRTIQTRTESLLAEGGLNNYTAIVDTEQETLDISSTLLAQSQSRWGMLEPRSETFNLINNATTMKSVLALLFRRNNVPEWRLEIEVPYHRFSGLVEMATINIKSTLLPRYEGTQISRLADPSTGEYLSTTASYEFQIEGIQYFHSEGSPLVMRLSLRRKDPADV